ncbi:MAG: hypothetical protein ACRENP_00490 [Longimicrobiales bacterium]
MMARLLGRWMVQEMELPVALPGAVRVFRTRWVPLIGGWLSGMRRPAAAVTLGDAILVHPEVRVTPGLLRHELAHVQQWRAQPLTFPLRYVLHHLRYGYQRNPYEVEARAHEQNDSSPASPRRQA